MAPRKKQSGQTIIEYIILMAVSALIALIIIAGFRKIQNYLWASISCEVIAACPDCPVDDEVRSKANRMFRGACQN